MSEIIKQNPFASPKASHTSKRGNISSLDDVIDYAKSKQHKSLFCNFLSRLAEQNPKAVENFLFRYVEKDAKGEQMEFPKSLENYSIEDTGGNTHDISERKALATAIDRMLEKSSHLMPRRMFLSVGSAAVGGAIFGGSALVKSAIPPVTQNVKNHYPKDYKHRQNLHAAANASLVIGGTLLTIGAISSVQTQDHHKSLLALNNTKGSCGVEAFDEFIERCDKQLIGSIEHTSKEQGAQGTGFSRS